MNLLSIKPSYKILLGIATCILLGCVVRMYPLSNLSKTEGEEETEMSAAKWEQERKQVQDPSGNIPAERLLTAFEYLQSLIQNPKEGISAELGLRWQERGPTQVAGRTRAILFDLNDPLKKKVFVGSVGGGLWKTDNITATNPKWQAVNDIFDNLAITTIAQNPTNPQILYFGTGEGFGNIDAIRGLGIWKSTNAGATWTRLSSTGGYSFKFIQKIVVTPNGYVYAATEWGVQRSIDGGITWQDAYSTYYKIDDLELAADGSLFASNNNGKLVKSAASNGANIGNSNTWVDITPLGSLSSFKRIEIATAPSDANRVYVLCQGYGSSDCTNIFSSENGGTTWTPRTVPTIIDNGNNSNFTRGQAWYDLIAAVAPNNPDRLFIGGVDILVSNDKGASWQQMTNWVANVYNQDSVHADIHALNFSPNDPSVMVVGCDGGLFLTNNAQATKPSFKQKNTGYNVTQLYSAALHPDACSNFMLAGAQDNGTRYFDTTGLNEGYALTGGDGALCFINQTNPNTQVTSYVYANYFLTKNAWNTSPERLNLNGTWGNSFGWFINPTDLDDKNNILYFADDASFYGRVDLNVGSTSYASPRVNYFADKVTAIKVDPNVANRIWVVMEYLYSPIVYRIDNAHTSSPTMTRLNWFSSFSNAYVSSIDVQKGNSNHLLLTLSNYGLPSVLESTDGGVTFTNVEGNLPDMPVRWGIFNPQNFDQALLATELGVWTTSDINSSTTQWLPENNGLANVRVDMLKYRESDYTLVAATHGRGLFTTQLPPQYPTKQVEQKGSIGSAYLAPKGDTYIYSSENKLLARIENLSHHNYGCVTVSVTRPSDVSTVPVQFLTANTTDALARKTFQVTPQYPTDTGSFRLTLFFAETEITTWVQSTTQTWQSASIIKAIGNILNVTPTNQSGGGILTKEQNIGIGTTGLGFITAPFNNQKLSATYGVGNLNVTVLPVELLTFTGRAENDFNILTWATALEINNLGFDIERSDDGKSFSKIGFVKAKGQNSTYEFTDHAPLSICYYQLRQKDNNGVETLSKTITLKQDKTFSVKIYSNPTHDFLKFDGERAIADVAIYSINGQLLLSVKNAERNTQIDLSTIKAGSYIVEIKSKQQSFRQVLIKI
jgi:hypothetical protein